MIKSYHPVSLNVVRGALMQTGLRVKRIRSLLRATESHDWELLEVEFDNFGNEDWREWSPRQLFTWIRGSFAADVETIVIEYRSGKWFARLGCVGHPGETPLFPISTGESSGSSETEVLDFVSEMLKQNLDNPV